MKKTLSAFFALITLLSCIAGCTDNGTDPPITPDTTTAEKDTIPAITDDETTAPEPIEILSYELETIGQTLVNENDIPYLVSDATDGYCFHAGYMTDENGEHQNTIYLFDLETDTAVKQADFNEIIKQRWPDAYNISLTSGFTSFYLPGMYENGVIHCQASHKITEDAVLLYAFYSLFDYEPMKPFESNSKDWWVEIDTEYDKFVSVTLKGINGSSFTYCAEEWGFEQYSEMCIDRQLIVHPTLNCALLMCQDKITENYLPPRSKALLISLETGEVIDMVSCGTLYSTENVEYPTDIEEFYWEINISKENHLFGNDKYIFDSSAFSTENGFEIQVSITNYNTGEEIFPVYYKVQLDYLDSSTVPPHEEVKSLMIDGTEYILSSGDSEIVKRTSKDLFTKAIKFTLNEQTVTVEPPIFTGLPAYMCYSYNDGYPCIDGSIIFNLGTADGALYLMISKSGEIISVSSDYNTISQGRSKNKYLDTDTGPMQRKLVDGLYYLYSSSGEQVSGGYDFIGYFYDGLALIENDNKIGLIDENGNEILSPCIEYDTVLYPPKAKKLYVPFMFEDCFAIPIGGEFAIININR